MSTSPRIVSWYVHGRQPKSRRLPVLVLTLLSLLLPGMAAGSEAGRPITGDAKMAFFQAWSERLQAMHSLHMVFTQEKSLRFLRRPLVARGELWLKGETLLYVLKNAAGETELEVRLDPHTAKAHYPLIQTLEVIDLHTTQASPLSIPSLTRDPAALEKEYEIELVADSDLHTLKLIPRDPQALVAEIRLTLKDFQPQRLVQVEKTRNQLIMHISTFIVNPDMGEAQLELHVPAGTNVTRPLP